MYYTSKLSKGLAFSFLIMFLFMLVGCGGGGGGDVPAVNTGGINTTPDIVKKKIADSVMYLFSIQSNPDQSNITKKQRIRRKPQDLDSNEVDTESRYKLTTGFNNDVVYVFGIPYTFVSGYLTVGTYDYEGYPTVYS